MRFARVVGVTALAAVACSTGEPARPGAAGTTIETRDFTSGTRLRARAWDVDGALVLRELVDMERGEACAFADGGIWNLGPGPSYWCLPVGLARHDAGTGPFSVFADRSCSRAVAVSPAEGPAAYAVVRPVDACAAPPEVHRAGEAQRLVPWVFDGAECRRATLEVVVQSLGERLPLESFVRAVEQVEVRGSRIASLVAVTADGARMTLGGFDLLRGEPVRTEQPRAGALRWVPARVAFEGAGEILFGDPTCTASVATKIARDASCPLTAALVFEDECGTSRFHELGPPIERSRLHARDPLEGDACAPFGRDGVLAYERGRAIPPEAHAPAFVVEVGGHIVRRRGYTGGGAVAAWGELIDVASGEPCGPALAHDGVQRCLPIASASATLFADADCTVAAFEQPVLACEQAPARRFVQTSGEDGAHVLEITGETAELYERTNGRCRPHASIVPSRGFSVTEADVTRFALVVEREPE